VLKGTVPTPDVLYFYCHAVSRQPNEQDKANNTGLVGTDYSTVSVNGEAISLLDLKTKTARAPKLTAAPLVFLNACQSAELSPYLYDGLVPYLVARGARGVLGTEVDTPVYFAKEFALAFLAAFCKGEQPVGELLRDMRRKYRDENHNILGLIYALYASGDTIVTRSVA
jgi:hypothetical protein